MPVKRDITHCWDVEGGVWHAGERINELQSEGIEIINREYKERFS